MSTSRVAGYRHGRVPRDLRAAQLLTIAERLFVEVGYNGFSMHALCTQAGVSRPVVYEHFASKDAAYVACVTRIRRQYEQGLAEHVRGASDLDTFVRKSCEYFMSYLDSHPRYWDLVHGSSAMIKGPTAHELQDLQAETITQIAGLLRVYAPMTGSDRLMAYAHALSGAGQQLGQWALNNPSIQPREAADHMHAFLMSALAPLVQDQDTSTT